MDHITESHVNLNSFPLPKPKGETVHGYSLEHSDQATSNALAMALDLIRHMRKVGFESRAWANATNDLVNRLTDRVAEAYPRMTSDAAAIELVEADVAQLSALEDSVSIGIRHYFEETDGIINRMKKLNPPLTSKQLRGFMEILASDRAITLLSLETLSRSLGRWSTLRNAHLPSTSPVLRYQPAF